MRSILVHIYDDAGLEARLQAAFDLARAFGGHLTCLHATAFEDYLATDPLMAAALPVEFSKKMRKAREALRARIEARLEAEDVSWDWVHRDEGMADALIRFSPFADLVVASLAGPALEKHDSRPVAASVATGGRAPVLAVPDGLRQLALDKPVALAWNGSAEAAAAMRGALPILKAAPSVHLIEIEEELSAYPRDLAARYLSRHDIQVSIVQREDPDDCIGGAIRQAAFDVGAGLIVMGAYGRSRLSEYIFGGATREMLAHSTIPLLLAH